MPASLSFFLTKLSEKAVQEVSSATVEPLYQIISSATLIDLDLVPKATLLQLQESLIVLLKTCDVEDTSASLFSLAILAKISSWQGSFKTLDLSTFVSDGQVMTNPHALNPGHQFFSVAKASKTLDLVVLKAILLCSRSCTLNSVEISGSLKLCTEIVQGVPSDDRSLWNLENMVKVKKLHEKMLRSDIDREVQDAVSPSAMTC